MYEIRGEGGSVYLDMREIVYNFAVSAAFLLVLLGIALVVEKVVLWLEEN